MRNAPDLSRMGRTSHGAAVRRPLSPHLQIYRPQISSVLSITHRATGIALSAGTLLLAWWLAALSGTAREFAAVQGFIASPPGLLLLFGWTASLNYHLLSGIRHLFWDAGIGYDLNAMTRSGWAVAGGAVLLTLCAWIVGFMIWRHA